MISIIAQALAISTEVLLIFAFLPLSRVEKNRLPFLPVFMAAITFVTLPGAQSSFYIIVGMVALRLVIFALFILFYYRYDLRHSIYLAMMYFLLTQPARRIVTSCLSYCLQHVLDGAESGIQVLSVGWFARSLLFCLVQILILLISRKWNPEPERVARSPFSGTQNILLLGLYLYVRYDEKYWGFTVNSRLFDLLIILIAYFTIIFATMLTTHMLILQRREQLQREISISSQQQYHAVMEQMRTDSSLRRIYHDLRKHLDALDALAGDQENIRNYLRDMTHEVGEQFPLADTGDAMLDVLLSRRIRDALAENISINTCVDLRQGGFIAPIDKVAIFCNILDNAIEAVRKVTVPAKRKIVLKADVQRGALLIRSSNYFSGSILTSGERLISTKPDPAMHGIGISSVRCSVAKYGGTLDISTAGDCFTITIFIPLPAG